MWVLNCSRNLPDITLHTTNEKVHFLFNQNFHKSACKLWGPTRTKTMQTLLSAALWDLTMRPTVGKCQKRESGHILWWGLIFSQHNYFFFFPSHKTAGQSPLSAFYLEFFTTCRHLCNRDDCLIVAVVHFIKSTLTRKSVSHLFDISSLSADCICTADRHKEVPVPQHRWLHP